MATKFKQGTSLKRKMLFHTFTFAFNSTEIGVWGAAAITTSVAADISFDDVTRQGATIAACYFYPAAGMYTVVKKLDKAASIGKKTYMYDSRAYRFAVRYTSPIEMVNSISNRILTKFGIIQAVKTFCGVEESDCFYFECPEYQNRIKKKRRFL